MASAIIVDYLKRPFIEGPVVATPLAAKRPPANEVEDPETLTWTDEVPPAFWPGEIGQPVAPSVPPVPPNPWTPATVPIMVKACILIVLTRSMTAARRKTPC